MNYAGVPVKQPNQSNSVQRHSVTPSCTTLRTARRLKPVAENVSCRHSSKNHPMNDGRPPAYAYVYKYVYIYIYIYMYIYTHVCIFMLIHNYIYIYIYTHIHNYKYIYIYIHISGLVTLGAFVATINVFKEPILSRRYRGSVDCYYYVYCCFYS